MQKLSLNPSQSFDLKEALKKFGRHRVMPLNGLQHMTFQTSTLLEL